MSLQPMRSNPGPLHLVQCYLLHPCLMQYSTIHYLSIRFIVHVVAYTVIWWMRSLSHWTCFPTWPCVRLFFFFLKNTRGLSMTNKNKKSQGFKSSHNVFRRCFLMLLESNCLDWSNDCCLDLISL